MGKRPHLSILDAEPSVGRDLRDAGRLDRGGDRDDRRATPTSPSAATPRSPRWEIQVAYVRALADLAQSSVPGSLRIFTGYLVQADGFSTGLDLCVRAVRECARVAADQGVILGVQNHHDVGVGVDSFVEFLDDVGHPNCRAMFDPWAPRLHGEDLKALCPRRLAPRMVQTTLARITSGCQRYQYEPGLVNYRGSVMRARRPLGEGFLDLAGFFAGLREGDSTAMWRTRCARRCGWGSEENLDRTARESLAMIRRLTE